MEGKTNNSPVPLENQTPVTPCSCCGISRKIIAVLLVAVLFLAGGLVYKIAFSPKPCSSDAKICPDGSSVGRVGPSCEFAPCPQIAPTSALDETASWKTFKNEDITFRYPPDWIGEQNLIRGSGFSQVIKDLEGQYIFSFSSDGNYNQLTGKPYADIDEFIDMPYQVKVVIVDGQEGRQPLPRAGSENINAVNFFSKDQKFIYTLELQTGDTALNTSEAKVIEGQKLFDQILSTFKFSLADSSTGEIKDWISFGDYQSKFMYKYPADWKILKTVGGLPYGVADNEGILKKYGFQASSSEYSLDQVINEEKNYQINSTSGWGDYQPEEIENKELSVDGITGKEFVYKLNNQKELLFNNVIKIYLPYKKRVIILSFEGNDQEVLRKILSTFKFLD